MCRVTGHDGPAGLLLKAFGRHIVNVCDSKGRWVATVEDVGFVKDKKKTFRNLLMFDVLDSLLFISDICVFSGLPCMQQLIQVMLAGFSWS